MKPAWDKLGDAYKNSPSVLIADVDCTSDEGQSVCSDNGVSGYPAIKYFTPDTGKGGKDYSGGRDFDGLEKFVKETLAKRCDPKTKEGCDQQEVAYIEKQSGKAAEALVKEAKRLRGMKDSPMNAEKRVWLGKRIVVLDGLAGGENGQGSEL